MAVGEYENFRAVAMKLKFAPSPYVIMRNAEVLLVPNSQIGKHADIDILCENPQLLANHLGASPKFANDIIHYTIKVSGKTVDLDLRRVDDGYYPTAWATAMLSRSTYRNGVYSLCPYDDFYSLLYHALLQKRVIANDYIKRFRQGAKLRGLDFSSIKLMMTELEAFMECNRYKFTYPSDPSVPLLTQRINNKQLINKDYPRQWAHFKYRCKELMQYANWILRNPKKFIRRNA